jgi:dolichol-phosphate mannosyltransferase
MVAYTRAKLLHLLKIDFVRFCIVGGTGFVINFILLTLLHKMFGLHIFLAQLISAEIALFINFMLHHHWTYKAHKVNKTFTSLIVQFHATSWPAILGSSLMVSFFEKVLNLGNLPALAISSIIALFWNFSWSKFVVWKDVKSKEVETLVK